MPRRVSMLGVFPGRTFPLDHPQARAPGRGARGKTESTMRCWGLPRITYGALNDLDESRPADLFVSAGTREAVAGRLTLDTASSHEVTRATIPYWESLVTGASGEVVYAVGGGLAVDAAKYVASRTGAPLVSIPTAISVDAFLTWASGHREDGCVRYVETGPPEGIFIDLDVIAAAPVSIRAAGITDVLSIATGRHDWRLAHEAGRNSPHMAYDGAIDRIAERILDASLECAASAGRGEPAGLRRLIECLALEVQLCNLIGHSRPEEGSEHYFAYAAEELLGEGLPHGDLVGPGTLIMAHLQGQDIAPLEEALRACHVPLDNIPLDVIRQVLSTLPRYCEEHDLPYGIAHTLTAEHAARIDLSILG